MLYYENGQSPTQTFRLFNRWAQLNNCDTRVTKKNVMDLISRFLRNEELQKERRDKASVVREEPVLFGVLNSLYQQPGMSLRTCAAQNDLSVTTTQRVARKSLHLYPYRLLLVQALSEFDKIFRVEACHRLLQLLDTGIDVIYSDEATFRTDGHVNRWNCRIWDYERPADFIVESNQSAKSVTVWAGMSKDQLYGPYFFPSTVTGDSYRAIISEMFIPDIVERLGSIAEVCFQQDGAPAHTAKLTMEFLKSQFGNNVISRNFQHEWPPRSPDLTPCDFYLWGTVKDCVFRAGQFNSVSQMQDAIIAAFNGIRLQKMEHVRNAIFAVPERMQRCIQLDGAQLQHW